jgi:hypothetical protein
MSARVDVNPTTMRSRPQRSLGYKTTLVYISFVLFQMLDVSDHYVVFCIPFYYLQLCYTHIHDIYS